MGYDCKVIRNDELKLREIEELSFEAIVVSPGPCTPSESGVTMDLIHRFHTSKPILGICLGHQALGLYFGANLQKAIVPMHGKTSIINILKASSLFEGLGEKIEVMRYHSLVLSDVKSPLTVIARTNSQEIMAIQHESLPIAGVQFHPESILTVYGLNILKNWFESIKKK